MSSRSVQRSDLCGVTTGILNVPDWTAPVRGENDTVVFAPAAAGRRLASASAITGPPFTPIFFNFLPEPNPMNRLSGDQNGLTAFSVPSSGRAVTLSSERTHSCVGSWVESCVAPVSERALNTT